LRDIVVVSDRLDPFENFAFEAALFEGPVKPLNAMLVYVCTPCAVIGRNQNPWVEVSASAGVPVLRRISGGGAVYMDEGNLNWAFLTSKESHDRCAELSIVTSALAEFGIESSVDERGAIRLAAPPHSPSRLFAGAKISGSARRVLGDRVLHHGTLLVDADLQRMDASLKGIAVLSSAAPRSYPSRVANLSEIFPGLSIDDLVSALSRSAGGRGRVETDDLVDAEKLLRIEQDLRSWEWIWGATPPFALELCNGLAQIKIEKGRVASVSGTAAAALEDSVGVAFDYEFAARAEALIQRHCTS